MPKYDDTNRGALFKNTRKESDKGPDYRGNLNVSGTEYWIAAWLKESKEGKKYMSLAVTHKDADKNDKRPSRKEPDEDSIPF